MFDRVPTNTPQLDLYRKIQAFELDDPRSAVPFSKRLAKENSWGMKYVQKAIEEYKKFIFLKVTVDRPIIAPRQIERVWHLHLIYTHSYWNIFCLNVLGMPLHCEPADSNPQASVRDIEDYKHTLITYQQWFGEKPPANIWFPVEKQFKIHESSQLSPPTSKIVEIESRIAQMEAMRSLGVVVSF